MNETSTNTTSSPEATAAPATERADASGARRRRLWRVATIAVAAVLPLLVWTIAVPLAGLDLVAGAGPSAQTVGPAAIVFAVIVTGFAAWAVLALLERFTRRSSRIFAIIGWTLLALSLLGPFATGASGAVLVTLLAMHVVTGATLVVGLPLTARPVNGSEENRA